MEADISRLKEITVLYCEDEEYLRDITKGILESFTKKQFICKDGAEGLEVFKENQHLIDLIITDVNMPNMNGLEMAKEIKRINPNMPIVVATAFSNSEYLLEAIDLGVDKYVLKPINVKKLLDIMSKSLLYHELRDLYLDQLTKLQNRNALIKDTKTIAKSTLALINIDKFSILNDLYGEDYGDKILLSFVAKTKEAFKSDLYNIYRVGSDNFVILCQDQNTDAKKFKAICKEFIKKTNSQGIQIGEEDIDISITIGIAQSNDQHAFEYAQRAIPKARRKYLDILEYDKEQFEQKKDIEENIAWIKKLKSGLTDGRFQPYFQPIIDAKTKEIYKYEALIRYIADDGTEIAPYKFLTIAKKARLFPIIIKVMLSSVLEIIKEKQIRVAVNLSFEDMVNNDTNQFIFDTLEAYKDEAKLLDFEILESEEIENFEIVKNFIIKIRSYGCHIGVDDFGAGYSNFNMLEALNVDFVKIDGSLIREIDTLPKHALIVETISDFCTKLGIKTVAEFVSSEEIYQKTKGLGIKYMQGWHFGKAISREHL
ncbi:EAL domain-containing protein [Arcobacteraceae bacterium]|nr:EAL domain-containing protein [Arcobacteraceae bacterium]